MRNALRSKDYHVLPSWLPSIFSETCCLMVSAKASAVVMGLRVMWFGSLKGSDFAWIEQFSSPVRCCSEAFVATRVAESFIVLFGA